MKVSLKSALMGLVLLVLLLGLVPTGILLDRRLTAALEEGVRDDLRTAPLVLADRWQNQASARMMHSREMAIDPDLVAAMTRSDTVSVLLRAEEIATAFPGESAVVIGPDGVPWMGPDVEATVVDSTRAGAMPVLAMESEEHGLGTISLAPVVADGGWMGAVGVWVPMTEDEAARLSVLTRSDVLLMAPDEELAAYTGRAEPAMGLFGLLAQQPVTDDVREFELDGDRYLVANAHVPGGARVSFVRALSEELAVVPTLRAVGAGVFGLALVVALAVGVWFATRLAEPVGSLAGAASRISQGDFDAPVGRSAVDEVD
ncbi:MAG: hypothetical protein HKO77_05315, partial [Gemmatimonadetes bacterium]|nr:hypothetical protein [Gemmatimonadota bacterium]